MKLTTLFRIGRAVQREAAAHGYNGDIWADESPPLGTLRQELAAVAIALDAGGGAATDVGNRALRKRFARAAVLAASDVPVEPIHEPVKRRPRAW